MISASSDTLAINEAERAQASATRKERNSKTIVLDHKHRIIIKSSTDKDAKDQGSTANARTDRLPFFALKILATRPGSFPSTQLYLRVLQESALL